MNDLEKDIESCLETLRSGGLILYPTDTIWGIGCDATNEKAVAKVYELKRRPEKKSMIVLVSDEKDILRYTAAPDLSIFDHLENDQRPTTVIYEGAIGLASNLVADDGSIAIRICREPFCRQLIKRFRKPVVSTSANISGESPPRIFRDISDDIIKGVDHVVKYKQDDDSTAIPSRIIRWKNGRVEVVRE